MRHILLIFLLVFFQKATAFVIWPNASAPCNTTLQACIDGSPVGEYIEIRSNSTITSSIFANKPISLVAGSGFRPVFTSEIFIVSNDITTRTIRVEGLTMDGSRIYVLKTGANATVWMQNNTLFNNNTGAGILLIDFSVSPLEIHINYNQVAGEINSALAVEQAGIKVWQRTSGNLTGEVYGNEINMSGGESKGMVIQGSADGNIDLNITGNTFNGGVQAGLFFYRDAGSGTLNADVTSNAFYSNDDFFFFSGLHAENISGTMNLDIINNSMIDTRWGMSLNEIGGTLDAYVQNNMVVECGRGFDFLGGVSVSNDYNLYYNNSFNSNFTPGPNSINSNPQIRGLANARLRKNSPARETGNGLAFFAALDAPFVDADGSPRIKKSNAPLPGATQVDIGAYESGDLHFIHKNSGSGSYISTIDHETLNNAPSLDDLHITSNWNPLGAPGIYNNANEAIYYTSGKWQIFNEEIGVNILTGAAFNVTKFAATLNTYEHNTTESGGNNTILNQASLDNNPARILSVTQHWTGVYNPHPIGLTYLFGKWLIINLDLATLNTNSNFNIYHQEKSKSAWVHRASTANISGGTTTLDNILINEVACAEIQVTQSAVSGVFNNAPIGIYYASNRWRIFNQDFSAMPEDAEFHVIISPEQIAECQDLIFKDGFE